MSVQVHTSTSPDDMASALTFCLPFPVSVNAMFITGRYRRAKSQKYEDWIQEAGYALNRLGIPPVSGQVKLHYEFQEGRDNRKRDVGNLEKALTDLLVSRGVIEADDNTIVREITLRWATGFEGVRVTIESVPHRVHATEGAELSA